MTEILKEKLTQNDPKGWKEIYDDILRFCKYNGIIPFGPAEELPSDALNKLANLPEESWIRLVSKYQRETFMAKPPINPDSSSKIRQMILGVANTNNNV